MKVRLEFDTVGVEDIRMQVLKSSEENRNDPEQEVSPVLVVIEVASIDSEKVTEMELLMLTAVAASSGEVEATVGGIVSTVNEVRVMVFPTLLSISVIRIVQFE